MMIKKRTLLLTAACSLALAACGSTKSERALSGGAIGAGVGAAASGLTGGNMGTGAVIGGVAIYYWIKDLKGSAVREAKGTGTGRAKKKTRTFLATPTIGDGVLGGSAAWEW
jgi:hypothetical protein